MTIVFGTRLVVKKWIPQYGVAVLKNNEIGDFVQSHFTIEKALLMSKHNSLVLCYSETYYHN